MLNTREKLEVIAHLGDHITYKEEYGICYDSALAKVIEDAYMTIKNGVTVQEWISVEDRLPNYFEHVLINCPGDKPFITVHEAHLRKDGLWDTGLYRYDKEAEGE